MEKAMKNYKNRLLDKTLSIKGGNTKFKSWPAQRIDEPKYF